MKTKSIIILILIIASFQCYSQKNNQFRFYYGFADSKLLTNVGLDGAASYDNKNSYELGFKYLRKISGKLSLETGINIFKSDVEITPSYMGTPVSPITEKLNLITIPVYANYSLGKYFYVNGGPVLDFDIGESTSYDAQTGIGYGLGIGAKYNFDNFFIYINPNFKRHASISFQQNSYRQRLTQFGIQIGVGFDL